MLLIIIIAFRHLFGNDRLLHWHVYRVKYDVPYLMDRLCTCNMLMNCLDVGSWAWSKEWGKGHVIRLCSLKSNRLLSSFKKYFPDNYKLISYTRILLCWTTLLQTTTPDLSPLDLLNLVLIQCTATSGVLAHLQLSAHIQSELRVHTYTWSQDLQQTLQTEVSFLHVMKYSPSPIEWQILLVTYKILPLLVTDLKLLHQHN